MTPNDPLPLGQPTARPGPSLTDALYRLLFGAVALMAAMVLFFLFIALLDGTALRHAGSWLLALGALAAVLGGAWRLRGRQRPVLAIALLAMLGVPGLLITVFALLFFAGSPSWQ